MITFWRKFTQSSWRAIQVEVIFYQCKFFTIYWMILQYFKEIFNIYINKRNHIGSDSTMIRRHSWKKRQFSKDSSFINLTNNSNWWVSGFSNIHVKINITFHNKIYLCIYLTLWINIFFRPMPTLFKFWG